MRALCIGHITYDIAFPVDCMPKENTKTKVFSKNECVSGPATIAAFLLNKWNVETYLAATIGNDIYGKKIITELARNNMNTKYIEKTKGETSVSVLLANQLTGLRTIINYASKTNYLKKFELDNKPDVILIDGNDYEASREILEKYPKIPSIIDAGRYTLEVNKLAKITDYLICSKDFAEEVTKQKINDNTIINVYKKLESKYRNKIIITLGDKGSVYKEKNEIKIMPSIKVKTLDSSGAGDIYHGSFAYGVLKNFTLEKTIKYATIASALSVTKIGTQNAIPSLNEVEAVYNEIK